MSEREHVSPSSSRERQKGRDYKKVDGLNIQ